MGNRGVPTPTMQRALCFVSLLVACWPRGAAGGAAGADHLPAARRGDTAVWLDARHALAGVRVAGRRFTTGSDGAFPTFAVLDGAGVRRAMGPSDPAWKVTPAPRGADSVAITYSAGGLVAEVVYRADLSSVRCDVSVLAEGDLRLVHVGANTILGADLGSQDYGIAAEGVLIRPANGKPVVYERIGNSDNTVPGFAAARLRNRILLFKPLTYSNCVRIACERAGTSNRVLFGGDLYFRPPETRNPATRLCH